jgi:hypothetical protein
MSTAHRAWRRLTVDLLFSFFGLAAPLGPVGWPALAALSCGRNCDCPAGWGAGLSNGLAAKPAQLASLVLQYHIPVDLFNSKKTMII